MPKHGKSDVEWKSRLRDYAAGTFKFGQGQKPAKTSRWTKEICVIEKCPVKVCTTNLFGKIVTCTCGYHSSNSATSTTSILPDPEDHSAKDAGDPPRIQVEYHLFYFVLFLRLI
jgi:hypothetical protein